MMNETVRAAILADLRPVRPLPSPWRRVIAVLPLAVLLLVAAPAVFEFRDLTPLGWLWSFGASVAQAAAALAVIALALREAIPGREATATRIVAAGALSVLLFLLITAGAWSASPVTLARHWWQIGAMCAVGSAVSALPAVVVAVILIVRAFPLRPARAGMIGGFGAGLLADAGWRLFCHFSEPAHVVLAHFGGVAVAAVAGAALTSWLFPGRRRDRSSRTRSCP